ncbi:MAG: hypothetical protein ACE5JN_08990 [Candidatus Methylomirabilia bacterium]
MKTRRGLSIVLTGILLLPGPLGPVAWADHAQLPRASEEQPGAGYEAGALAVNVVHVPGKAVLCTVSGVVGFVMLVVTFGSGYATAAWAVREGCGGAWTITAEDLKRAQEEGLGSLY